MSGPIIPANWEVSDDSIWGTTPWNARARLLTAKRVSPLNGVDHDGVLRLAAAAPALLEVAAMLASLQDGPIFYYPTIAQCDAARAAITLATGDA